MLLDDIHDLLGQQAYLVIQVDQMANNSHANPKQAASNNL